MANSDARSYARRPAARAAAVLALGAVTVSGAAAAAPPAQPAPQLRLVAAAGAVTIDRDPSGWAMLDLGMHVVTGAAPVELRVTRASYAEEIRVRQVRAGRPAVDLPAGSAAGFSGLRNFFRMTLTDDEGATVLDRSQTFCPNAETYRARPDAPDRSPYPYWCSLNPFTIGGVWGIQAGWSTAAADLGVSGMLPPDVADGTYTARLSVNRPYRTFFGMPASASTSEVELTVRTLEEPSALAMAKGHHAHHGPGPMLGPDKTSGPGSEKLAATRSLTAAAKRPAALAAAGPRPDLRALPAWGIRIDEDDTLAFSATVWNGGTSPLVVDGFRLGGQDLLQAHQYFFDAAGKQIGSAPAGSMEWDPREGHEHWHFTDFARYRLLPEGDGTPLRSGKEAFCLANTDEIDYTIAGAKWQSSNTSLSTACGARTALAVRQVLDIGSGDTYDQFLPGQSFDIAGLPNGVYYIEVTANPESRLQESDESNNTARRKVVLGGVPGARTVDVPPHEGVAG